MFFSQIPPSGLRILYIDQENYELHEVAHFDVYPTSTRAQFKGTWSNYPYYRSGKAYVILYCDLTKPL
jgi:hypothetical protein